MWVVILIKAPPLELNNYRSDFFPSPLCGINPAKQARKIYYKKNALELKREIEIKGGKARIERVK